jgi:hypothetical protein
MMAMWAECRQRRPFFFPNPVQPSPAVGQCRQKSSTLAVVFGQQVWMFHRPFHFVRDAQELKTQLFPSSSRRVRIAAALAV